MQTSSLTLRRKLGLLVLAHALGLLAALGAAVVTFRESLVGFSLGRSPAKRRTTREARA